MRESERASEGNRESEWRIGKELERVWERRKCMEEDKGGLRRGILKGGFGG